MEILNEDRIDVGLLIANNIKYMVDAPKNSREFFYY